MATKFTVDPVTRIEGHLKIDVEVDGGVVKDAWTSGTLFRGLELILQGRDPRDAQQMIQRICGVCPTGHATAGTLALDMALECDPPPAGRIIRNLIFGSNYIQSHILHFFHLAALDYADATKVVKAVPPFVPSYPIQYKLDAATNKLAVESYVEALNMRRKAHEMLAIWGGKMPHVQAIVPGGVTERPDTQKIYEFLKRLEELTGFIEGTYLKVVGAVKEAYPEGTTFGIGCKNMLAYGAFPTDDKNTDHIKRNKHFKTGIVLADGSRVDFKTEKVTEEVTSSWYECESLSPETAVVDPKREKEDAYSWLKSPRYEGKALEVGPLARQIVGGNPDVLALGPAAYSVIGRHYARAVECLAMAKAMKGWVMELKEMMGATTAPEVCTPHKLSIDTNKQGVGLTEASRGALGHWHKVEGGKTKVYNAVVPTTWNAGPRTKDAAGNIVRGPMEQALIGTPVSADNNPTNLVRVVRSFDPCFGCAIHLMRPDGTTIKEYVIG
ncbi:MAG: nickel-dependent hydrogenase large subunit [Candidatus Saccharibacteria bacterium]